MKISDYIQSNASQLQTLSKKQNIAQILTGDQDVSVARAFELRDAIEVAAESFDDDTILNYPELCKQ